MKDVRSSLVVIMIAAMITDLDPFVDKGFKEWYDKPGVSARLVVFMGGGELGLARSCRLFPELEDAND